MEQLTIRKAGATDADWMRSLFIQYWGGDFVVSRGETYALKDFTGEFIAELDGKRAGLIAWKATGEELEIMGLVSLAEKKGIGTALVGRVLEVAKATGVRRVCLVTTNDNLNALGFWQKRGFRLVKVYPNSLEETRRLKPALPLIGENGIPLRDEIELEMRCRRP